MAVVHTREPLVVGIPVVRAKSRLQMIAGLLYAARCPVGGVTGTCRLPRAGLASASNECLIFVGHHICRWAA
jgi:hypothetical protein